MTEPDETKSALQVSISVSSRSYYSQWHLYAGAHFMEMASEIERDAAGEPPAVILNHRAYVMGAITESVAFVEAVVNEVLQDVADGSTYNIAGLSEPALSRLEGYWVGGNLASILTKYDDALRLCGHPALERGAEPCQSMADLIALRNFLVHFKPASWSHDADDIPKLNRRLDRHFARNYFASDSFPGNVLGAPCAQWAVRTATEFVGAWCKTMGIEPYYAAIVDFIATLPPVEGRWVSTHDVAPTDDDDPQRITAL
jgi:hypothetical protein